MTPLAARQNGLSVVIPAYNEAARLPRTLTEMLGLLAPSEREFEILVVDDGSSDQTAEVVRDFSMIDDRVRRIALSRNRGKGYAVRIGVEIASGAEILIADADGATPFAELAKLELALDKGADAAIGTRAAKTESQQVKARWYRKFLGGIFNGIVSVLVVSGFTDTQCGFKLFRSPMAKDTFPRVRLEGFAFDVELLAISKWLGYRIKEVAIDWSDQPGSKVNLLLDAPKMLRDLLSIRWWVASGKYRKLAPGTHSLSSSPDGVDLYPDPNP